MCELRNRFCTFAVEINQHHPENKGSSVAHSYFQFKQFRVYQDQCAMKVCTDSCVLGAYVDVSQATRLLDIGTGTGLLSLMAAQRTSAPIDAIEIETAAAQQAIQNIAASPWATQITVIKEDVLQWTKTTTARYDCILSNPPFFSNHLKRSHANQNIALHGESLQLTGLAQVVSQLLLPNGTFTVLLPPYENDLLKEICQTYGLYPTTELQVLDYTGGKLIRTIRQFASQTTNKPVVDQLTIKTSAHGTYTDKFAALLNPYYLYL